MTLISCIQCSGQVATDAKQCPHCGSTYFSKSKFWISLIFGIILGGVGIYISIAMFKALDILF